MRGPQVRPVSARLWIRTERKVPRLGLMLVGWGGNNGSTLTAALLANRLRLAWPTRAGRKVGAGRHGAWAGAQRPGAQRGAGTGRGLRAGAPKREGEGLQVRDGGVRRRRRGGAHPQALTPPAPQEANYYGSLTQAGTMSLGLDSEGREVFVPFSSVLPMVAPDDLVLDGARRPGGGGARAGRGGAGACCVDPGAAGLSLRLGHLVAGPGGGHAAREGAGARPAGAAVAAHGAAATAALRIRARLHRRQPGRARRQPHPGHARAAGALRTTLWPRLSICQAAHPPRCPSQTVSRPPWCGGGSRSHLSGGGIRDLSKPPPLPAAGADPQGHPRLPGQLRGGQSHRHVDSQHRALLQRGGRPQRHGRQPAARHRGGRGQTARL